jgi:inorganic pyrophosphatase
MRAKVIGVMKMRDEKGEDDKLVAVHADDPEYADYADVSEMPAHRMRELKRFFQDYKALENKKVLVSEPQGRKEALRVLRDAIKLYASERPRLRGAAEEFDRPARRATPARAAKRKG